MGRDETAPRLRRVIGTLVIDYAVVAAWLGLLAFINFTLGRHEGGIPLTLNAKAVSHATAFLLGTLPVILYFSLCEGSRGGQTLGKRFMRLRVVAADDMGVAGMRRAFLRNVLRFLPWEAAHIAIWYVPGRPFLDPMPWENLAICIAAIALSAVYLLSMWTPDGRTIYDRLSGTLVVKRTSTQG